MFERNLGDLGENLLRTWCSQVGIDATPPEKDRKGWDFLLELPLEVDESIPLDHQPSRLRCWVQVKSTDKRNKKIPIKLSNWESLAKDHVEPAFFLNCEFDKQTDCQRAFLVHVGEMHIWRVLMELRKLGTKNYKRKNRVHRSLIYDEINKLASLDGNGLVEAIKKHVPNMSDYVVHKKNLIEKLGYEGRGRVMNVTFDLPDNQQIDPIEHFINLSLGLIPHVETTRVELKDMRFGIEAPELTQVFDKKGFLTVPDLKPVEKGMLVFQTEDFSKQARLEADIYIPKGFDPELIKNHEKVRFASPFCDLIVRESHGELSLKWPEINEKYKLKELFSIAQIFILLEKAKNEKLNITSEILFRDKVIKGAGLTGLSAYPDEVIRQAFFIEVAWKVAKHFEIQETATVSIVELLNQNLLPTVYEILNKEKVKFQAKYWLAKDESHNNREIYIPNVLPIALGEYILCFLLVVAGQPKPTSIKTDQANEWHFYSEDANLIETRLLWKRDIKKLDIFVKSLLERAIARKSEEAILVLTDESRELLNLPESR